jgi:hypothetical protein
MREPKEVLVGKIIAESKVESKVEPTKAYEENPQEGHKKEAKELNDSKEHHVEESKLKNQELRLMYITTHTTWKNKSHQGKGMGIKKLIMDQHGTKRKPIERYMEE